MKSSPTPMPRRRHLATSVAAVIAAMSGIYGGRAQAQALPVGCTDGNNNIAENGETITCLPPPATIGGIATTVDDLTMIVGDVDTPTSVDNAAGNGISLSGAGPQTLTINNAESSVSGSDAGVRVAVTSGAGDLTVDSEGSITGSQYGIYADNDGTGDVNITTADVTSTSYTGIRVYNSGGSVTIDSTRGAVRGDANGIAVSSDGSGAVRITTADVTGGGTDYAGIDAYNSAAGTSLTIDSTLGTVEAGGDAISADNDGNGALEIRTGAVTSTAEDGIRANNSAAGTSLTISSTGTVEGYDHGVRARNYGNGALEITTADVTATNNDGIFARNTSAGTSMTIRSTGAVTSAGDIGIYARNGGSGALSITTAAVTGTSYGMRAENYGTSLTIESTGAVEGDDIGITAYNYGSGALSITTAAVTGGSSDGIYANNSSQSSGLTISSTGKVEGGKRGISALNDGDGALNISTAAVTGGSGTGIHAKNYGTSLTVESTGAVDGGAAGIYAKNSGSDALNITTAAVSGTTGAGIRAGNYGTSLTIRSTGTVEGYKYGITARNHGSDAMSITTAAVIGNSSAVTGTPGYGIRAENYGTSLTIESTGAIEGDNNGIDAYNRGSGALSITTAGVTGGSGDGIYAYNAENSGALTIESTGKVEGGERGIVVRNYGNGALDIGTAAVSGGSGDGIDVYNGYAGTSLTIRSTGAVEGGGYGIAADNYGSGGLSITTAAVTSTSDSGIKAYNSVESLSGGLTIDSTGGAVNGGEHGISADNSGNDALDISTAAVTGGSGDGIRAKNSGTSLTIESTGAVEGDASGIVATNSGSGALSITTAAVTGGSGDGIQARNFDAATSLTIDSTEGTVKGGDGGIIAGNDGDGALNIKTANVTAYGGAGIAASNTVYGTDVTIDSSAGAVQGYSGGIRAFNRGGGALSVTTAAVTGASEEGMYAYNSVLGTSLTITSSGAVRGGGGSGIRARNFGDGALEITTAAVTGMAGDGVYALTYGTSLEIDTSAGEVSGDSHGIIALQEGTGALTITTADVTGADGSGIYAYSSGYDAVTIDSSAGAVSGAESGISVSNHGDGDVSVTAGDVSGGSGAAIAVANAGGSTTTVVADGVISGGTSGGIRVNNGNDGDIDIRAYGEIRSLGGDSDGGGAVFANTTSGDISVVLDAVVEAAAGTVDNDAVLAITGFGNISVTVDGSVAGGLGGPDEDAVDARVLGDGNIDVTFLGEADEGIRTQTDTGDSTVTFGADASIGGGVSSTSNSGDLVVQGQVQQAGDQSGSAYGEVSLTTGGGDITVRNVAAIGGDDGAGIAASSAGGDIVIRNVGPVSGGTGTGILADARGGAGGAIEIVGIGEVTGASHGIQALTDGGGAIAIDSTGDAVTGGTHGIDADNSGSGALTIDASDVTGTSGTGISASNGVTATDLTIRANGNVTGGVNGILAHNYGSGTTSVTVSGDVTGGTGDGLSAISRNGASITISEGASVTGAVRAIVLDGVTAGDATNDVLTLAAGSSISGDVLLNAGDDVFNDGSGAFTAVFGGGGFDVVNFTGGGRIVTADGLQGFETFNIDMDGLVIAGDHVNLEAVNFLSGTNTLTGSIETTSATVAAGATLNAADGAVVTGNLTNNGTLNVGDSPGVFTVDGNLVLGDTSVVPIEIGGTSDQIVVTGDVTLGGTLDIINIGATGLGATTRTLIGAGTGLNGEFHTVNVESGGLLVGQEVVIDVVNAEVTLTSTTTTNPASSIDGLNDNQIAVGNNVAGLLAFPDLDPALGGLVWSVGSIPDVETLAAALTDLTPQGLDVGLRSLTVSQSRFTDLVLGRAASSVAGDGRATVWGAFDAYELSQDGGGSGHIDFDSTAMSLAAGASGIEVGPVSLGVAGAYTSFDGEIDGLRGDESEGNLFHLAGTASAAFTLGAFDTRVDTVVAYATGDQELVMRLVDPITDGETTQRGDADVSSFDWAARFAVDVAGGENWSLTPYLQAGVNIYSQEAVTLGGAAATALAVEEVDNTRWQVGVGTLYEHRIGERTSLEARVAGVQYFGDTEHVFVSRFALAPADAPTLSTTGREVDLQVQLDAALSYEHKSGYVLSAGVFGEAGDLTVYGVNARIAKRF